MRTEPMFHKTFQIFLVIFVVVLTALVLLMTVSVLVGVLMPLHSDGIVAVSGGVSFSILKVMAPVLLALLIAAVYIFTRPRLR